MSITRLKNIETYQIGTLRIFVEGATHGNGYDRSIIHIMDHEYQILDVQKDRDLMLIRSQIEPLCELTGDVEGDILDYIDGFFNHRPPVTYNKSSL